MSTSNSALRSRASKASNEHNAYMKARRLRISLLLATANIVGYIPVLSTSKELRQTQYREGCYMCYD
jgi:hypothetical protein